MSTTAKCQQQQNAENTQITRDNAWKTHESTWTTRGKEEMTHDNAWITHNNT